MFNRMFYRILHTSSFPLEVFTAVPAILWGFWLLLPLDTFSASLTYTVMASVASELAWGLYFLLVGVLQILAIHGIILRWRRAMAVVSLFSWTFMDLGFWLSGSASAAAVVYLSFVLAAIWLVVLLYRPIQENHGD